MTAMPTFDPDDLVGRTFLQENNKEDGTRFRCRIVETIREQDVALKNSPEHIQFRVSVNNDQYEEIMMYQEILDHIERSEAEESEVLWKFKRIVGHEGPLSRDDPNYKGSLYNVMMEWEQSEVTREPLSIVAADDPVTCAIYAKENGLLELDGWK